MTSNTKKLSAQWNYKKSTLCMIKSGILSFLVWTPSSGNLILVGVLSYHDAETYNIVHVRDVFCMCKTSGVYQKVDPMGVRYSLICR